VADRRDHLVLAEGVVVGDQAVQVGQVRVDRQSGRGIAVQERCREAIRNYLLVAEARVRAMNRWVE